MLSATVRAARRAARVLTAPFRGAPTKTVRHNPLGVELLELRETPATFRWLGGWSGSDQAAIPQNWTLSPSAPYVRSTVAPANGDATLFDPLASQRDCFNLGAVPGGSYFDAVKTLPGYRGNVGAYGLTLTRDLWLDSSQATFTLQGDTSVDRYFKWTAGKLAGSGPTTLRLIGGTATILPGSGSTLECTPRLSFEGTVTGTISTGTLKFMGDRTITVTGTSTVSMTNLTVATALAAVEPVQVKKLGPNDPPATLTAKNVVANTALLVDGGTAHVEGGGAVKFTGVIPDTTDTVRLVAGALVIQNGTTLEVGAKQSVGVAGGKLATKPIDAMMQPPAKIKGAFVGVAGGEIVPGDGSYTPEIQGHKFSVLRFEATVAWSGGTFKPTVDPAQGKTTCDRWESSENFFVGGKARVEPGPDTATLGNEYAVLKTDAGKSFQKYTPDSTAPSLDETKWYWKQGTGFGTTEWTVKRGQLD